MNCREFQLEWVAINDPVSLSAAVEQHRRECRRCAAMTEDLGSIASAAAALRTESEPPQRVWAALRNQLEMEGLIRESAARPSPTVVPHSGWRWLRLPLGVAYAAVFFVALSVVYLYNEATHPGVQPPIAGTPSVPALALTQTETVEQDRNVDALLARVPEEQRATFVSNWNQVNNSIESLQSFVEENPSDPFAVEMLKNSLQQKEYLRGTLVGWEGN